MSAEISIPIGAAVALASAHVLGMAGLVKWIVAREVGHLTARLKSIEEQGQGTRKEIHELQLDLAKNYWTKEEVQDSIRRLNAAIGNIPCKQGRPAPFCEGSPS